MTVRAPRPLKTAAAPVAAGNPEDYTDAEIKEAADRASLAYATAGVFVQIPVELLRPSATNPRGDVLPDVNELAASIRVAGVLEPLRVLPLGADGRHEIVMGHRRHLAAQVAQLATVPCIIESDDVSATDAAVAQMIENLQRVDLSPLQEARGYAALKADFGLTQKEIATSMGRNPGHVTKRLQLLEIPEAIAARVGAGEHPIPIETALAIAKLPDNSQATLGAAAAEGASAEVIEQNVRHMQAAVDLEKERARQFAGVIKAGIDLLNVDDDGVVTPVSLTDATNGPISLQGIGHNRDTHPAKLPCFAAVALEHPRSMLVDDKWISSYVVWVCTDPASHRGADDAPRQGMPGTGTPVKESAAEKRERQAAEARTEGLRVASAARRAFATALVRGKLPAGTDAFLAASTLLGYALTGTDLSTSDSGCFDIADMAATTEPDDEAAAVRTVASVTYAGILGDIGGNATVVTRYALAAVLDDGIRAIDETVRRTDTPTPTSYYLLPAIATLNYLTRAGYKPTDIETKATQAWPTFAACLDAQLVDWGMLPEPADPDAVVPLTHDESVVWRINAGVLPEAIDKATLAGVSEQIWLKPGVKTPTGRCALCRTDTKIVRSDRAATHTNPDSDNCRTADGLAPPLLTLRELEDLACATCAAVGSDDRGESCPDCHGRGVIARVDMAAVATV